MNELRKKIDDTIDQVVKLSEEAGKTKEDVSAVFRSLLEIKGELIKQEIAEEKMTSEASWSRRGDNYFSIDGDDIRQYEYYGCEVDKGYQKIGNLFRTREEAENRRTLFELIERAKTFANGFKPDWEDPTQIKHNTRKREDGVTTARCYVFSDSSLVYFPSEEAALSFLDSMTEEEKGIWFRGFN